MPMQTSFLKTRLDAKDRAFLLDAREGMRLSLYLPWDKSWREPAQERIQLRDLRREAERKLAQRGISAVETEALLAPIDRLLRENDVASFKGAGAALFSSAAGSVTLLLPHAPAPRLEADSHFRLDGVLDSIGERDRFHLLCLSLHSVRLWDCDAVGMREASLPGIETDIRKTLHFHETQPHNRKEIENFFRQVDHAVRGQVRDTHPVLLAGVAYLLPLYRSVSGLAHLVHREVAGSPEAADVAHDLHARAYAVVAELQRVERNQALGLYVENLTRARTCAGYTDVVPSAFRHGLTHLFLREGRKQWGYFDPGSGKTTLLEGYADGAQDLSNLAAAYALSAGAQAYSLTEGELPADFEIAALHKA